jgi:nucleoside-diphosphate-sugar epimerase
MMFKNKRALVTGGAGFIGSHLVDGLVRNGAQVTVIDDLSSGNQKNLLSSMNSEGFRFVQGSICDLTLMSQLFKGVDYVFHQAAIASVPRSLEDPLLSHQVNLTGTLNVLLAARENRVKKLVFASSSAVYGNTPTLYKQEHQIPQPQSPYAVAKLAGEHYCQIFSQVFGLPTICLRYFNVYGPRQDQNSDYAAVIPRFIQMLIEGHPPLILGDGQQTRDFIFVDDVAKANLSAAVSPATGIFNVGSGRQVSLNQLSRLLLDLMGKSEIQPRYAGERAGDIKHSLADISLSHQIGFSAEYDLRRGLAETIKAYTR